MSDSATIREYMTQNQQVEAAAYELELPLFLELNEAYAGKPVIAHARELSEAERRRYAAERVALLDSRIGLRGQRVLEVGCGAGDVSAAMAPIARTVVGADIATYPTWDGLGRRNLHFRAGDLCEPAAFAEVERLGPFDRIVSLVVWEHVEHPHALLQACHRLLTPGGKFYLRANLYRSAIASHLYRHVHFPWPHLLFEPRVFEAFFRHQGLPEERPAWLNKLTFAQYLLYFDLLGFDVQRQWLHRRELDGAFYARFYRELGAYPVYDLTLDFFDVVLMRRPTGPLGPARRALRRAERRVEDAIADVRWSAEHRLGIGAKGQKSR